MNTKRGQLTLFIILALIIVAGIIIFFFWVEPSLQLFATPQMRYESCISDAVISEVNTLALKGGLISVNHYFPYKGEKVPYYCFTDANYETCTVQVPLPHKTFQENLKKVTTEKISNCYENSADYFKELGYDVTTTTPEINLTIVPNSINVEVFAPTQIESTITEKISTSIPSNLYDQLMVATSILQFEVAYGDSSSDIYRLNNPEFKLEKYKQGDSTTIYILTDKTSETKLQFASRSLVFPAGYGL